MAVIGIDLGTTNSLAAYWDGGEVRLITDENGQTLFPSVVGYIENEGLTVGKAAKERLLTHGKDTVSSFKRFMGTDKTYELGGKEYKPMELSAMVLERIKRNAECFLKEEIEEAIITVPAYFNDKQRSDTKKAAKIAGLKADRLINEPSAAALAYRMKCQADDMTLLVFDFGGGTLDLSYVECFDNIIEIVAVAGDNYLGGDDIDRLIAEHFCRENGIDTEGLDVGKYAELIKAAETAKIRLETEKEVEMELSVDEKLYRTALNDDILFEICMPLFGKIKKLFLRILNDAESSVSNIDDLIMVGGSSRLSVVKRFLTELLGKEPVVLGQTDQVVAMGAGVYAGIRSRNEDIRDMLLTDVCPFTLGIECWHKETSTQGYLLPTIERNSTLPACVHKKLVTISDYQTEISVKIYQGEEYYAKDNVFLGEVSIPVEPAPAGRAGIDVYFTYDINGILYVEVANSQNVRRHILLANQKLSDAELKKYMKDMEELLIPPIQMKENQEILAELNRYYEESSGNLRRQLGYLIMRFENGLQSGRNHIVRKVVEDTKRQLELLEARKECEEEFLFDGELKFYEEDDMMQEEAEGDDYE